MFSWVVLIVYFVYGLSYGLKKLQKFIILTICFSFVPTVLYGSQLEQSKLRTFLNDAVMGFELVKYLYRPKFVRSVRKVRLTVLNVVTVMMIVVHTFRLLGAAIVITVRKGPRAFLYNTIIPFLYNTIIPFLYNTIIPFLYNTIIRYWHNTIIPYWHNTIIPYWHNTIIPYWQNTVIFYWQNTVIPYWQNTIIPYWQNTIIPYWQNTIIPYWQNTIIPFLYSTAAHLLRECVSLLEEVLVIYSRYDKCAEHYISKVSPQVYTWVIDLLFKKVFTLCNRTAVPTQYAKPKTLFRTVSYLAWGACVFCLRTEPTRLYLLYGTYWRKEHVIHFWNTYGLYIWNTYRSYLWYTVVLPHVTKLGLWMYPTYWQTCKYLFGVKTSFLSVTSAYATTGFKKATIAWVVIKTNCPIIAEFLLLKAPANVYHVTSRAALLICSLFVEMGKDLLLFLVSPLWRLQQRLCKWWDSQCK